MLSEDLKCFTGNECKELDQCPRGCFCSSDDRNCRSCHQAVEDCRLEDCPLGCECDETTNRCEVWPDDDVRHWDTQISLSRRDILREDTDAYLNAIRVFLNNWHPPAIANNLFDHVVRSIAHIQEEEKNTHSLT